MPNTDGTGDDDGRERQPADTARARPQPASGSAGRGRGRGGSPSGGTNLAGGVAVSPDERPLGRYGRCDGRGPDGNHLAVRIQIREGLSLTTAGLTLGPQMAPLLCPPTKILSVLVRATVPRPLNRSTAISVSSAGDYDEMETNARTGDALALCPAARGQRLWRGRSARPTARGTRPSAARSRGLT